MDVKIALLTIGTELTEGIILNKNSHYLSRELFSRGYCIKKQVSVPDKANDIKKEIKELMADFSIVIATGGLGPTQDDVTRESIADALKRPLAVNNEHYDLAKKSLPEKGAKKLSSYPKDAILIESKAAGAAGFYIKEGSSMLISLPGVPSELESMFEESVKGLIEDFAPLKDFKKRRIYKFVNLSEVQVEEKLNQLSLHHTYGILPNVGEVHLYLTVSSKDDKIADKDLRKLDKEIEETFKKDLFGRDNETLEQVVVKELSSKGMLLSVAESSTGGLIGQRITSVKGASEIFIGGFITYSNPAKEILGVNKKIMISKGAVSEEVASQMAESTLTKTSSDLAVSVTGIAGPDGASTEKPIGLHYIGLARKDRDSIVKRFVFRGGRNINQWQASQQALIIVREACQQ